jgi:hypothetical protein
MFIFVIEQPGKHFEVGKSNYNSPRMGFTGLKSHMTEDEAIHFAKFIKGPEDVIMRFKVQGYGHLIRTGSRKGIAMRVAYRISEKDKKEAIQVGMRLKDEGWTFDRIAEFLSKKFPLIQRVPGKGREIMQEIRYACSEKARIAQELVDVVKELMSMASES